MKTLGFIKQRATLVRGEITLEKYSILVYTYINKKEEFMKSERIMKIFEQYVRKYDMNNSYIKSRYFHSLKVMEICRELATGLGIFSSEEIAVCELIGLFHEIGNFSKTPNYQMDTEDDTYKRTIDVLFGKKLIREISKETKYDDVIKMTLFAYDKNGFPPDIDEKTKHMCAIIKDAHNLDFFRLFVNYPYVDTVIKSYPNSLVYEDFKKFKTISSKVSDNASDEVLVTLSKMYSFNYRYSYYLLKQNNYISRILDSLCFDSEELKVFFKQLMAVLNDYVDRKIGVYSA